MSLMNRRNAIKTGLLAPALIPLLPVGDARAQPFVYWHEGHRVMTLGERAFGLSSVIFTDERFLERLEYLADLSEFTGATEVPRVADDDYERHVGPLLHASYTGESIHRVPDGDWESDWNYTARSLLESEPVARDILSNHDSRFYWVEVNPYILVVIVPNAAPWIAVAAGTAVMWALRPFANGFFDEAGRATWDWIDRALSE